MASGVHWRAFMRLACEHLKDRIADIMLEMTALTADEPWVSLPAEHRVDGLPNATERLFDWALCDPENESHRVMALEVAAVHGRTRREQGLGDDVLLREYYLLREAIWRVVRALHGGDVTTEKVVVMGRLDRALSTSQRAALLGYYSAELTARGDWPHRLHLLCAEAALPPLAVAGPAR